MGGVNRSCGKEIKIEPVKLHGGIYTEEFVGCELSESEGAAQGLFAAIFFQDNNNLYVPPDWPKY